MKAICSCPKNGDWCMCNPQKNCGVQSPSGLTCCRAKGHNGYHIAKGCDTGKKLEEWKVVYKTKRKAE